jgi:hypothetical protein
MSGTLVHQRLGDVALHTRQADVEAALQEGCSYNGLAGLARVFLSKTSERRVWSLRENSFDRTFERGRGPTEHLPAS